MYVCIEHKLETYLANIFFFFVLKFTLRFFSLALL